MKNTVSAVEWRDVTAATDGAGVLVAGCGGVPLSCAAWRLAQVVSANSFSSSRCASVSVSRAVGAASARCTAARPAAQRQRHGAHAVAGRQVMPPIPAGALPAGPQPPVFGRQRQHGRRMPRQPSPPGATPGSRAGLTVIVKDSLGRRAPDTGAIDRRNGFATGFSVRRRQRPAPGRVCSAQLLLAPWGTLARHGSRGSASLCRGRGRAKVRPL